jgi:hypothetical protein
MPRPSKQSKAAKRRCAERGLTAVDLGSAAEVALPRLIPPVDRSVLMGSFHQDDLQFGKDRNKQCGAISLTAVLKSNLSDVWTWTSRDLDDVLIKGTVLYRSMNAQRLIRDQERGYIAVSELPRHYKVWNTNFAINYAVFHWIDSC